jgi:ATP synthase protein I
MTPQTPGAMRSLGEAATIGLMLAFCIFAGTGLGVLLDRWLRTGPWLTLLFMLLGIVAGFYNMIRMFTDIQRQAKQDPNK